MKSVMALVLAGSGVAVAQDAVQWRVEDGGNGHWYKFVDSSLNWLEANDAATALGGHLATLTSASENEFAKQLVASIGPSNKAAHLGGRSTGPGNDLSSWYWITGEPWNFTDWCCSNPSLYPSERALAFDGGLLGWNNIHYPGDGNPVPSHGYLIEWSSDCNSDGFVDYGQVLSGLLQDDDGNGVPDCCESKVVCDPDCDQDGISDEDEIQNGSASDFNANGIPDNCEADCDGDGLADFIEIDQGFEFDCNFNAVPDGCELADGSAQDVNGNTFLDVCEVDCNGNDVFDFLDVLVGTVQDCTLNGVPDSCDIADGSEFDCDFDGVPDNCQIASDPLLDLNGNSFLDSCEIDCNQNGSFDYLDVLGGISADCDANTIPDECDIENGDQLDCQNDGTPDSCQLIDGTSNDCNSNGTPDDCDPDFDGDLIPDDCDSDIDGDGCPNSIDACPMDADGCLDTDMDGICDYADPDDDGDGVDDLCDVDSTFGQDCDSNGIDDSCDPDLDGDLIPDNCDEDDDGDGVSDICDADSAPNVPPGLDPFQWTAAEGGNSHWYAGVKPSGTVSWDLALQFSGVAGGRLIQLESEEEYLWFRNNLGRLPEGSFTDTCYGHHIGAKQLSADPD